MFHWGNLIQFLSLKHIKKFILTQCSNIVYRQNDNSDTL